MEYTGKVAIITGATGQLGQAIAVSLAERGMDCVCHYHTHDKIVEQLINSIEKSGRRAAAVRSDLVDPAAAGKIIDTAQTLGPVRVLINSASVFRRQPVELLTHADVSRMMTVNLTAPLMMCSTFATYFKMKGIDGKNAGQPFAAIINMVDVAAVKPWAKYSPYCASRAALVNATKSLAKELAPGVTVNAVAPGIITRTDGMDESEKQKQLKRIPAGRFAEPKDITRTIDFLLDNPYITGQLICVDGGRTV